MRMVRRHLLLAAASGVALPRLAAAQPATQTARHGQGETAVPRSPQRVVVFDIAALDILDALGVEAVIGLPTTPLPNHLAAYGAERYAKLGTLFEPNYEAVNAARPDLIIIGGRSAPKYADLSRIAPTVSLFADDGPHIDAVAKNTEMLAGIFGRQDRAATLITEMRTAAADVAARTPSRGRGLIVLTTGTRMSAYGPGSRFGLIHDTLGVPAAAPNLTVSNHGQAINSEFILQTNPDWLFVVDRDAAIGRPGAAMRLLDNPLVRQTKAWKANQVVTLDPIDWYILPGGIQATRQMIAQIAAAYARG